VEDPRAVLAELVSRLKLALGENLLGLYLFGSLAAGWFQPGRSDLDLLAVLEADVEPGEQSEALAALHAVFVADHPQWAERVEVMYVSRAVLQTFAGTPTGRIARISPGEPFNLRQLDTGWLLDWHSVCTQGETLVGPSPLELGPPVDGAAFRRGIVAQLADLQEAVRAPSVAYVPAQQGYIVVTLCRALYALETGEQTSKEAAVAWAAARFPEWARFVNDSLDRYWADVSEAHRAVIRFTDFAVLEAEER
jgi:hypothetical protein